MKKKLLTTAILLVAAIALVVTTMLATMAYLTQSAAVSNTFTVGNVSIQMFESKVNADGEIIEDVSGQKTADGNSYHLKPGKEYVKDPTIYVDSKSDNCYLFIKVRNQIRSIEDGNLNTNDGKTQAPTMREQLLKDGKWIEIYKINNDESIYAYTGTKTLSGDNVASVLEVSKLDNGSINLFQKFTIDEKADISKFSGAKVTITAFAIQSDVKVEGDDNAVDTVKDYATLADLHRLWNIVSSDFEFEYVEIPDDHIGKTPDEIAANP